MSPRLSIRPATTDDLSGIAELLLNADGEAMCSSSSQMDRAQALLGDRCLLLASLATRPVACAGLDLDDARVRLVCVRREWRRRGIATRLLVEVERLAVQFGMLRLATASGATSSGFFRARGYAPASRDEHAPLQRDFPRRQTRYGRRVANLLKGIGIPVDYGRRHRLRLQAESRQLAAIGHDVFGREQMLHPEAARAWLAMQRTARQEGVDLQVASAYRSVGYQVSLIERKKQSGQTMQQILAVSAAPGFSEHHTGRAVDVATAGSAPVEESFESTEAFEWLLASAHRFGFQLSYPRNNRHGIAFEPWHWRHGGGA